MRIEPFKEFHIELLRAEGIQAAQADELSIVPAQYASVLAANGPAFTGWDGTTIVGCAGMIPLFPHYGVLWALLSKGAGRNMLAIHRAVLRFIEMTPVQRLEATVKEGFEEARRWVESLGFECEGAMRHYGSDGSTFLRYALVRP